MLDFVAEQLAAGRNVATIISVGGNVQVTLKVHIERVDSVGMVARVKGMLGGFGEPRVFPWASIASMGWD